MQQRKLLAAIVVAVLMLTMVPALAGAGSEGECRGQGYWRRWMPAGPFTVGDITYTRSELLGLLGARGGGAAATILSPHFAAAIMNAWSGCAMPSAVQKALVQAGAYLADPKDSGVTRQAVLGWKDLFESWNENALDPIQGGQDEEPISSAVLLSVEHEGTRCTFGTQAGDMLTLTFSDYVYLDGTGQSVQFATADSIAAAVTAWEVQDKVVTIIATSAFNSPRPTSGDYVVGLAGIVDAHGVPVAVPEGGVQVSGVPCTQAVLESVVYAGVGDAFGSHADDTLTLTFSHDVVLKGGERVYFQGADSLGNVVVRWTSAGNILTLTINSTFSTPRPAIGEYVVGLDGVSSTCGCAVLVPAAGVPVTAVEE